MHIPIDLSEFSIPFDYDYDPQRLFSYAEQIEAALRAALDIDPAAKAQRAGMGLTMRRPPEQPACAGHLRVNGLAKRTVNGLKCEGVSYSFVICDDSGAVIGCSGDLSDSYTVKPYWIGFWLDNAPLPLTDAQRASIKQLAPKKTRPAKSP